MKLENQILKTVNTSEYTSSRNYDFSIKNK